MDGSDWFYSRCLHCKKKESVFRKKYYYENGATIQPPSVFYICQNPECLYSIKITTGKKFLIQVDREKFEWILIYDANKTTLYGENTVPGMREDGGVGAGE